MDDKEIMPEQFLTWYESFGHKGESPEGMILDVREDWEWEYYHLDGSLLMPMQTIPAGLGRIPSDQPVYVICAHGIRSAAVCDYLRRNGYGNAVNVVGGMAAVAALQGFRYD